MRQIMLNEIDLTANLIWNDYERGQWYERRGLLKEALESYRAATSRSPDVERSTGQDTALIWLQYGKLSMRLRSFSNSESAYAHVVQSSNAYAQHALNQWAALLLTQGLSDPEISKHLSGRISGLAASPEMIGCAMFYIGAYREAAECFRGCLDSLGPSGGIMYAKALIRLQQTSEALRLLEQLENRQVPSGSSNMNAWQQDLRHLQLLCQWKLAGNSQSTLTLTDPLELAKTAVSVGLIPEAEWLLSLNGIDAGYALICLLYNEGYITEAVSHIEMLGQLPIGDAGIYSEKLCVIAAEVLYDQGKYEEASSQFQQIRQAWPSCTAARFGEAACHLQSALLSLSRRLETSFSSPKLQQEIMEHIDNIVAALNLVDSSGWHTSWTPSQKRVDNKRKAPCAVLLN
ncbi:tetratricopeptide repeat protein [Paenibacillus campinasensis]|uniref:Tetratricopeptide repeat protein n=1 Tax=Paenibacillus campinasensis TaxID=66347 RepID=A0ABW9SWV8_9BACL|nr:tetratricopeptide repeat protein [Paenibacillus campinasensis]MUG64932.1 tetratricopeptide repeat protein [Paenibacillus campinasensis]